jgi:hypothetical protein
VVPAGGSTNIYQGFSLCEGSTYIVEWAWQFTGTKNDTSLTNVGVVMNEGGPVYIASKIAPGKWHTANFTVKASGSTDATEFVFTNYDGADQLSYLFDAVTIKLVK